MYAALLDSECSSDDVICTRLELKNNHCWPSQKSFFSIRLENKRGLKKKELFSDLMLFGFLTEQHRHLQRFEANKRVGSWGGAHARRAQSIADLYHLHCVEPVYPLLCLCVITVTVQGGSHSHGHICPPGLLSGGTLIKMEGARLVREGLRLCLCFVLRPRRLPRGRS